MNNTDARLHRRRRRRDPNGRRMQTLANFIKPARFQRLSDTESRVEELNKQLDR